jgi:uncharacterized protein YueI
MKKIFCILFVLISTISFAQMNRGMGRTPQIPANNKPQKKVDPVKVSTEFLKKELNLDTFQEAAAKIFVEENIKEREYILGLDITQEDRIEKLKVSTEKMNSQIKTILNADQIVLFDKLKDKNSKDKKKKGKKDKKEEKDELILDEN